MLRPQGQHPQRPPSQRPPPQRPPSQRPPSQRPPSQRPLPQTLPPQTLPPQGLYPQGLYPQGLHPQGPHPLGLYSHPHAPHPQGLHPHPHAPHPQGLHPHPYAPHPQGLYPQGLRLHPQGLYPRPQGLHPHPQGPHPQGLYPQGLHIHPHGLYPQGPHPHAPHPQGLYPQGLHLHPQGLHPHPQGLHPHPQGLHPHPQGLHPHLQGLHPHLQGLHPQGLYPRGLHPQARFPPGRFPPGQFPPRRFPPRRLPPRRFPPRRFPPRRFPPGRFPPGPQLQGRYPRTGNYALDIILKTINYTPEPSEDYKDLNYLTSHDPKDLEYCVNGPQPNHYRHIFLKGQDLFRPPGQRLRTPSDTGEGPTEFSTSPCDTPSSPSSAASMDIEMMLTGKPLEDWPDVTPKPHRRTRSVDPPSSRRSVHTPNARFFMNPHYPHSTVQTPAQGNAPTPHAMAARRALEQRRVAAMTPGRSRRQSFREQRETPMNILRNLGRALAPTSNVIASSSSPEKPSPTTSGGNGEASGSGAGRGRRGGNYDDDDDELPIDRPRLSMPIDEGSSDDLQPPQSSMLDEGNMTVQSVELPRRATSEGPAGRSFLGIRPDYSEEVFWDEIYGDHSLADPFARSSIARRELFDPQIADLRDPPDLFHDSTFNLDMPALDDIDEATIANRTRPAVDGTRPVNTAPVPREQTRTIEEGDALTDSYSAAAEEAQAQAAVRRAAASGDAAAQARAAVELRAATEARIAADAHLAAVSAAIDARVEAEARVAAEARAAVDNQPPVAEAAADEDMWEDVDEAVQQGDETMHQDGDETMQQDDEFPDIGDFGSVSSLGDAQMEALTKIDYETLGREPERPDDDIIGYPHGRPKKKKKARISKHNIEYPQLPPSFVRQVTQAAMQTAGLTNQRVSADALDALSQASDWFLQQLGDDLGAYANHANRRTIEERDVIALMHRQRVLDAQHTLFHLANQHLPRELQQLLRCALPTGHPGTATLKRKRPEEDDGEEEREGDEDEDEELVFPEDEDEDEEEEEEEEEEEGERK